MRLIYRTDLLFGIQPLQILGSLRQLLRPFPLRLFGKLRVTLPLISIFSEKY